MLEKIAKYHKEWIRIARSFVGDDAEDVVQDMYIKIKDKTNIGYGDDVNKYYVYLTIKTLCYDRLRKKKHFISIDEIRGLKDTHNEEGEALEKIFQKMDDIAKGWEYFEAELFEIYTYSGLSLRAIANGTNKEPRKINKNRKLSKQSVEKGTGISVNTLFHSLKNCKEEIRETLWEDYLDFKNGDYHLL